MEQKIALEKIKSVYLIGIKGSGMVAFAEIFHALGKQVYGSDVAEKFFTDATLKKLGIQYFEGFAETNLAAKKDIDLVVYSTAYNAENNVEVRYAQEQRLPMVSYPELIGLLSKSKNTIAICGTHGKTTTSAMTTLALKACGADPTAIIGSKVKQLDASTVVGESELLVIEADEYQNKLANYSPFGVVLLNVDFDHPDYFASREDYIQVFVEFISKIPPAGFLVVCGDDPNAIAVAKNARCKVIVYYSLETEGQIKIVDKELRAGGIKELEFFPMPTDLKLQVAGKHNRLNATATLAVCAQLNLDSKEAQKAVESYRGVARRFEEIGKRNGAVIVDDYAHHPTELKATLSAAKEKFPHKNIICVFHPHTFTRTKALLTEFATSFTQADEVLVLDIYGSAREQQGGITSQQLVEQIKEHHKNVKYLATIEEVFQNLKERVAKNDLVLTVGAGDVDKLARKLAVED